MATESTYPSRRPPSRASRRAAPALRRLLFGALALTACRREAERASEPPAAPLADAAAAVPARASLVAARPYALSVPSRAGGRAKLPLVVLLHGYGSSGRQMDAAWGVSAQGEREGFVVAAPDGTLDRNGARFWNATVACCNFFDEGVDDVAYLRAMIDDIASKTAIDESRVFVLGHSNGGFMALRLACDASDRIRAVVSLAGAAGDATACHPSRPVAVALVHGTGDVVIRPDGGNVFDLPGRTYPSLSATSELFRSRLGCSRDVDRASAPLDLDLRTPGAETRVERYRGCRAPLELWTMQGSAHVPAMGPAWLPTVWSFFSSVKSP